MYFPYLLVTHLVTLPQTSLYPIHSLPHLHTPLSILFTRSLTYILRHSLITPISFSLILITSFLHIINLSSPLFQLPVPLPSHLPIFISSYILHFSIPLSSRSSPSLTQDLTNPPGRPSYTELPRPVERYYNAWFLVSWAPPLYIANVSSVQYRVYYLPNIRAIDTPTNTTEVLAVAPGQLISEVAVINSNKEVISERGPVGRSESLHPRHFQCTNKSKKYSYSTSILLNVDIPSPHTLCVTD